MTPSTIYGHPHNFLDPEKSKLSAMELAIIRKLSGHVVFNTQVQACQKLTIAIVDENKVLSEPRHGILIGDAGCGKTTLIDILKKQQPEQSDEFQLGTRVNVPTLTLSLPAKITPRELARQMLRALGDKSSLKGTCAELTERLCRHLKDCGVKLVVLDEFQHLFSLGGRKRNRYSARLVESQNWIKSVINDTHVSVLIMGTPDAMTLIEDDDQLQRRFTRIHVLEPFGVPSKSNTDMVDFVNEMLHAACESDLPFTNAEFLCDRPADAERLFLATGGIPSRLKDLVIRAALCAHRRNSAVITMHDFTVGFEQSFASRRVLKASAKRRETRVSFLKVLDDRGMNPFTEDSEVVHQHVMKLAA